MPLWGVDDTCNDPVFCEAMSTPGAICTTRRQKCSRDRICDKRRTVAARIKRTHVVQRLISENRGLTIAKSGREERADLAGQTGPASRDE